MTTIPIFVLAGQSNADKSGIDNRIVEQLVAQGNAFEFVKTSESSTSIYPNANRDDWDPGTKELFTQLVTAIKAAMTNVTKQGDIPQINILWVQGENDATTPTQSYYNALTNFITQLRTQIGDFSAKFYISTLPYASNVRDAQYEVAADMSNVYTIDTTGAGFWDGIHYDKPTVEWIANTFMDMTGITVENISKYKNTLQPSLTDNASGHPVISGTRYLDYTFNGGDVSYSIRSRSGDDNITTGAGNDTIYTGGNYDTVHAGGGNDFVSLEDHADLGYGGDGNDTIWGGPGNDTIYGEAGDDSMTGDTENDIASGGDGNDTILGGDGNDTLYGDAGNDSLSGGYGADVMDGGDGNDYLTAFHEADSLSGGAGNDTLYGGGENDTLHGGTGNDSLFGDTEDDILSGDGGLDTLYGGAGNDTLIGNGGDASAPDLLFGGSGNDLYYVYGVGDGVSESSVPGIDDGGNDTVVASIDYTLPDFVENLILTTAATGVGNGLNNVITATTAGSALYGLEGDDTLIAVGQSLVDGGAGNDRLTYTGSDNTLTGGDGNDVFATPASGADASGNVIDGGDGIDTIDYSAAAQGVTVDLTTQTVSTGETLSSIEGIIGSAFADLLSGDGGVILSGGGGNDTLAGGAVGGNLLDGGAGDDLISFLGSASTITGGAGDDHLVALSIGGNSLDGAEGSDTIDFSQLGTLVTALTVDLAAGLATAGGGSDTVTAIENVIGSAGNDVITGDGTANVLSGGAGDDTLIGGDGTDTLDGGDGSDFVVYAANSGDATLTTNGDGSVTVSFSDGTSDVLKDVEFVRFADAVVDTAPQFDLAPVLTGAAAALPFATGGKPYLLTDAQLLTGYSDPEHDTLSVVDLHSDFGTVTANGDSTYSLVSAPGVYGPMALAYQVSDGRGGMVTAAATVVINEWLALTAASMTINYLTSGHGVDVSMAGGTNRATLSGGADGFTGGSGTNRVYAGGGDDILRGGGNDDNMHGEDGNDVIIGNAGNDILYGDAGRDSLEGGAGNDGLYGGGDADTLNGADGNDILDGGGGADLMTGGAGNDTYLVDNGADIVTELVNEGTDLVKASLSYILTGNVENLTLTGTGDISGTGNALANALIGNTGNNALYGADGNDTLDGGIGADTLNGGAGNDTYLIDNVLDAVVEAVGQGTDTVKTWVDFTLSDNIEILAMQGTGDLAGTGNAMANTLLGNTGNNLLSGADGNDTIDGGAGNDTMLGGAGNDVFTVDSASDVIVELADQGTDVVKAGVSYTLSDYVESLVLTGSDDLSGTGSSQDNSLTGNSGNNALSGGDGNDTLDGGIGADTLDGGVGNDVFYVDNGGDIIIEAVGQGTDTVRSTISYALSDNIENLSLTGTGNTTGGGNGLNNALNGNNGSNLLSGGDGNDALSGFDGADTLIGGSGNDSLDGGNGADTFVFAAAGTANGVDRVANFVHGSDSILFTGADYGFDAGHVLTAAEFTTGTTAVGRQAQFLFNPATHTLYWDHDGAGGDAAVALAVFTTGTVSADDLHLV